jgi:hypothetical protein
MMELNREQIIKALECCSKTNCKECPYTPSGKVDIFDITCSINMARDTLTLIKELTEENERLKTPTYLLRFDGGVELMPTIESIRDDAVRKMQEKIRAKSEYGTINMSPWQLDQIAKEVLEENK